MPDEKKHIQVKCPKCGKAHDFWYKHLGNGKLKAEIWCECNGAFAFHLPLKAGK